MTSFHEQAAAAANQRLRDALDKPLPPKTEMAGGEGYFDPWSDLFDGIVGAYNAELDQLAIDVLKSVRDRTTFDLVDDEKRGLAAELFMHMLATWLCAYGTSPRGVFPATDLIKEMWPELITKWEFWFAIYWGEEPNR